MATSGKGGFRNNGQPRVQLKRGLTRVAQLKAALRELWDLPLDNPYEARRRRDRIVHDALVGTYVPTHMRDDKGGR